MDGWGPLVAGPFPPRGALPQTTPDEAIELRAVPGTYRFEALLSVKGEIATRAFSGEVTVPAAEKFEETVELRPRPEPAPPK